MLYLDAGTTWSKIIEVSDNEKKYSVIPSSEIKNIGIENFAKTTGHAGKKDKNYVNEIVALAQGAKKFIGDNDIILDLGSRDIKWVKFKDGKFQDMDWNTACASAVGATVEMLLKFYNVDCEELSFTKEKYTITCGIFGLEKIMDEVSAGLKPEIAISKFVHGLAYNAYTFCKKPEKFYVSGGFCENKCFMDSLNYYSEAIPLGRFVLCEGLIQDLQETKQ